ncbi:MAG: alpha/beta hydrolase [Haliscomenobacter sp.]|nr:alpha/beta fold hydrolase [Haliscomenobacter sp.]MBK9489391.1 alpha/beta hydrolase [Haliscomenobacter sp.]
MPAPRTLYLNTTDNINLRCLVWDHVEPRAVIAIVHGIGEHCGRYNHVAEYFNQQGYAVMAYDHRGHGESGGPRGHAPNLESLLDDLALFLRAKWRKNTGSKTHYFVRTGWSVMVQLCAPKNKHFVA